MECNLEKILEKPKLMKDSKPNFDSAIEYLNNGKIVVYPTETLYGMGVDAQNSEAIKYLFQIKKRSLLKPVPVLIPNKKHLEQYCEEITPMAKILIQNFWPGALTIVLKSNLFPKGVTDHGKVGFRVSSHPLVQNLLLEYGKPITATSANISNQKTPDDPMEFFRIFPKDSFMLIQDLKPSRPLLQSTVIDCTGKSYKILREGAIPVEEIQKVLQAGDDT